MQFIAAVLKIVFVSHNLTKHRIFTAKCLLIIRQHLIELVCLLLSWLSWMFVHLFFRSLFDRHSASFCVLKRKSWELCHMISYNNINIIWIICKKNPLNSFRFTSHQKKWEKCLLFNLANDCLLKRANSQNDNYFHSK